jgi:hypothetical protein
MDGFNEMEINLGNLYRLSGTKMRSISPENFGGEPGEGGAALEGTGTEAARELGQGWKISPSIETASGENRVLADTQSKKYINGFEPDRFHRKEITAQDLLLIMLH